MRVVSVWPTTRELFHLMDTSAFVGTNPTVELITSGLPVTRAQYHLHAWLVQALLGLAACSL